MSANQGYPPGHWLRDQDPDALLEASRRQQALAYSRVKNAFLFELLGDPAGCRVLDFGCGAGWLAVEAARRGAALALGLDALLPPLRAARLLAGREGLAEPCRFVQAAHPCALAPGPRFEAIILRDVIEHVPDDAALLSSLADLLAPGGRLVLATQNARSLNYVLEGGIRRILLGQKDWMGWDPTHLRFYTPGTLARTLAQAGLAVTAWRAACLVPNKIPTPAGWKRPYLRLEAFSRLDRWLGRTWPFNRLGYSLMVRAERQQ